MNWAYHKKVSEEQNSPGTVKIGSGNRTERDGSKLDSCGEINSRQEGISISQKRIRHSLACMYGIPKYFIDISYHLFSKISSD
ncbi:hypothetical protein PoB_004292700 [Plakobranchus ocellatus]|uniref:Uncharacterized protein n=1 Tax=Plakobranchus ocellatus TaxID=259542 RepID=A0AAV4BB95_9GAST|nr:hypothetical protein PoB_004292700 [Plakobranchus ocellatus]